MNALQRIAIDYANMDEDETKRDATQKPKRKNKKRTFCKVCGGTDHVRSTKHKCPKHKDYVQPVAKVCRAKPGRPFGTTRQYCRLCGPEVTDHVNCSKRLCPKHPEYKPKTTRSPTEYNVFVKAHFKEVKQLLGGDKANFAETMKLTGVLWNYQKNK